MNKSNISFKKKVIFIVLFLTIKQTAFTHASPTDSEYKKKSIITRYYKLKKIQKSKLIPPTPKKRTEKVTIKNPEQTSLTTTFHKLLSINLSFFHKKILESSYSSILSDLFNNRTIPAITLIDHKNKKTTQPLSLLTQAARQEVLRNPPSQTGSSTRKDNLEHVYRVNPTTSVVFNGYDLAVSQCNPENPLIMSQSSLNQSWHLYKIPHSLWPSSFLGKPRKQDFNAFLSPKRERYRLWYIDHRYTQPSIYCFNPEEHTIEKTIVCPDNIGSSTYFKLQPLKTNLNHREEYHCFPELFTISEQRDKDEYGVTMSCRTPFWHGVYSKATREKEIRNYPACSPSLTRIDQVSTMQAAVCQCRVYFHENFDTWSLHLSGKTIISLHTNGSLRLQILDTSLSFNRGLFKPIAQTTNRSGQLEHLIAYMGELNAFQLMWARAYLNKDLYTTNYYLKKTTPSQHRQTWKSYNNDDLIKILIFRVGNVSSKIPFAHNIVFIQNKSECYIYIRDYYQRTEAASNPTGKNSIIIDLKRYRVSKYDLSEGTVEHYNLFEKIPTH